MTAPQRRATDHVPPPVVAGNVVEAPVYVRVRPGWLEKWLFIAVFVQIMMTLFFLFAGSFPLQSLVDTSQARTALICDVLHELDEKQWMKYKSAGICP